MDGFSGSGLVATAWRDGRCLNEFYCELASHAATINVAPGARFICPSCGKDLALVSSPLPSRQASFLLLALFIAAVSVAGLAFYAGCLWHVTARARADRSAPAVSLPMIQTLPLRLLAPARPSRALLTLVAPAPVVMRPVMVADVAVHHPAARAKLDRKAEHTLPPVAVASRAFSTQPLSGGFPAYPDNAPPGTVSAIVHVSCLIGTDGKPSGCQAEGEAAFRRAVQNWLGRVRFAPTMRGGVPVATRESWDIRFDSDGTD